MFDGLSAKLGEVFDRLKRRGALSEADVSEAMNEVRVALLEADVALPVVSDFIAAVQEKAVGHEVLNSVTPGQMVVKVVHDHLVEMLGPDDAPVNLDAAPPVPILMVGLQGSGKTTTAGKLALRLIQRERKKVLLAGLDVQRPAAQEQLRIWASRPVPQLCSRSLASNPSASPSGLWTWPAAKASMWLSWIPPGASLSMPS